MYQTFSFLFLPKIKSAATEVTAQKTQTPIVAKLIKTSTVVSIPSEFAFFNKFTK